MIDVAKWRVEYASCIPNMYAEERTQQFGAARL